MWRMTNAELLIFISITMALIALAK